tara:strand:+ start:267 stop:449 length:183 start_codon:yes stop_codon:yes gene_type:complete
MKTKEPDYFKTHLFLDDSEAAEILENIRDLQHLESFKYLKKQIVNYWESTKALKELDLLD